MLNRNIVTFTPSVALPERPFTHAQQRLLDALAHEENRQLSLKELYCKASVDKRTWYNALKNTHFVAALDALGVPIPRHHRQLLHIHVDLALDPNEELEKDVWDIRRLKSDYPKHKQPGNFKVNFSWIENPLLKQQVKLYFRQHLSRWESMTFQCQLSYIKHFLKHLPQETHIGTLDRRQVENILPLITRLHTSTASICLRKMKAMLTYMATSPAWLGPRPPRFLIWDEDIPSEPHTLPRPIPPDVLDQFDLLLEEAVETMKNGQKPSHLQPSQWDALLILRRTGMRFEDVAHLKTPDEHGHNGCIEQDSEGYWWVRLHYSISKMNKDHRIPTKISDGLIEAVRRQQDRIKNIPDHFGGHYLFRDEKGVLSYSNMQYALQKFAHQLTHESQLYRITPHQFRHTIATDMIEQGVDIYTVKEFLGHSSLAMTGRYVKVYLKSLKVKYDAYRVKKQQTYASEMIATQVQVTQSGGDLDGGWVEGKVGKLYLSPLPDGAGNCAHLPMHDPCPDVPHCPTCPKLRASQRHLLMWENKVKNLRLTVEALRANPLYDRARQKHEQELRHAEKVVETIKQEGFWDGRIHNSQTNKN